jgi:PAS domain S-box-containing protein
MSASPSNRAQSDRRLIFATGAVFLALYLAWLLWGRSDATEQFWIGSLTILATALAGAGLATWAAMKAGPARAAWTWLAAGLWLWVAENLARMLVQAFEPGLLAQLNPLDGLYLAGAAALAVGLLRYPLPVRFRPSRLRLFMDITITSAALLTLVYLLFLKPWLASLPASGDPLSIAYPLSDLVLLLVLVNLYLAGDAEHTLLPFAWITLAVLAYALSNLAYNTFLNNSVYQPGSPIDLGWVAGDLFMGAAALSQTHLRPNWDSRLGHTLKQWIDRLRGLVPLLVTILLGWFVVLDWRLNDLVNPIGLWVTFILALVLIARQGMLAGELEFQQYASLVNSVAEPAFVCDGRGRFSLANPALLAAAGYERETELLGRYLDQLIDAGEESADLVRQGRRTAAQDAPAAGWSGEISLLRKDGSTLPVFLSLRPVLPAVSERLALAGTAHDLSLQKQQQADLQKAYLQIAADHTELEKLNAELELRVLEKTADLSEAYTRLEAQNEALLQLDRLKSDFVSLVSHELRAPLTNINSGIELLAYGTHPLGDRSSQTLRLVRAEIQRLTRFVETILDISALDAGRLPLYPAPMELASVVRVLKNQIAHLPGSERVVWAVPADTPSLLADEQALTSVLFHLLDNAFKYAPDGPITVSSGSKDGRGWVRVSDSGPGIPPESLPYLFERFYRSHSEDNQTVYGHGLGLYIVKRLLGAMQGEASVENLPGGGACFTCWLPLADEGDTRPVPAGKSGEEI